MPKVFEEMGWEMLQHMFPDSFPSSFHLFGLLINKKRGYLKEKINEFETYSNNKVIRHIYIGINEFKKGYQPRTP
jgi:hypothetical protein